MRCKKDLRGLLSVNRCLRMLRTFAQRQVFGGVPNSIDARPIASVQRCCSSFTTQST
ncbi:hypothetical protein SJA_P1-01550 (plasmid) [Sphingobium indicum UT26S]|uniref:Uncharacterized protein n=1 Tax=Sphingobium indicum (strain DSM 16413 / CCM 7287 / MTCC 6362 / UT26 / NBRC 101211 / UT26S) TaxID=452662 RepID=D4Z925_SPHIU|nr:hypothetical protein SJA_P1-01550 [Sphingobium indicum UT26S]